MTRGELKIIYDKLSNLEKKAWAKAAGYKSYEGLYKYLGSKWKLEVYTNVIEALIGVIGEAKLNKLLGEYRDVLDKKSSLKEQEIKLLKIIFNTNNKEQLENVRNNIISACDSQITRIGVKDNFKKERIRWISD